MAFVVTLTPFSALVHMVDSHLWPVSRVVKMPACHAGDHGFDPHTGRQFVVYDYENRGGMYEKAAFSLCTYVADL